MAEPEQPDNAKAKAICLLSPGNSSALLSPIESAARIKVSQLDFRKPFSLSINCSIRVWPPPNTTLLWGPTLAECTAFIGKDIGTLGF